MHCSALPRIAGLLTFVAFGVLAQVPDTVVLEDLTWTELSAAILAGKTTVIVPIGGTEQSGPHIVLGKHNVRARVLAEKIARQLGNSLVAPVIAYVPEGKINPPTAHMRFPGTITLPNAVFEKTLESAARSFKLHGFRDIVFLGDHGGYQQSEKIVADQLNREWVATPVRVHPVPEYYRAAETGFAQALKHQGFNDQEIGTHAGLADTSLSLAVDPRLVRRDRLSAAATAGFAEGVHGDPRRASAALGQVGVDAIVTQTVAAIKAVTQPR
ncbi:MAG: creatininase family protein [Casimicrobiaceae bacterium]